MGDLDKLAVKGNFLDRLARLEKMVERLERREITAQDVTEITRDLGSLYSGRLMAITASDPTEVTANGAFFDADGVAFSDGQTYHVGGVNNGQLMFGLRAVDGAGVFAGGAGVIDQYGQHLAGIRYALEHLAADPDGNNPRRGSIEMVYPDGGSIPVWRMQFADNAPTTELMTNGGFETGDTTGWNAASGTTLVAEADPAGGYRGKATRTTFGVQVNSSVVPVTGRYSYEIAGKVAKTSNAAGTVDCSVRWYSNSDGTSEIASNLLTLQYGKLVDGAYVVAPTSFRKTVRAPAAAQSMTIQVNGSAGGIQTVLLDDFSAVERQIFHELVFDDNGFSVLRWGALAEAGTTQNRNASGSFRTQIMVLRVFDPIRIEGIKWYIRSAGNYRIYRLYEPDVNTAIRELWRGTVGVTTENTIYFEKPEVLTPGTYYLGLYCVSGATAWSDYNAATYTPTSNPAWQMDGIYYNTTSYNYVPGAKLMWRRGTWN